MNKTFKLGDRVIAPDSVGVRRRCRVIRGVDQCGRYQIAVCGTGQVGGIRDDNGAARRGTALVIYARPDEMEATK